MSDTKKEGFSYISPDIKRKKALVFLLIETILIVLVVILAFGVLNYFSIFPLYKMNPDLFSWLPTKPVGTSIPNSADLKGDYAFPADLSKLNIDLTAQSDVGGYDLTLENKEKLISLLKSWNVYGNYYYGSANQIRNVKPLEKIHVHLVSSPQKGIFQATQKGEVVTSYDTTVGSGEMNFNINISDTILKNKALDSKSKGAYASYVLMSVMYRVTHNVNPNQISQREEDMRKALKGELKTNYFDISSK